MKYLGAILGLATASSAIDLAIHFSTGCTTSYVGCTTINPTVCCYAPGDWGYSGSIAYIPTDWAVELRMDNARNCNSGVYQTLRLYGRDYACHYTGFRVGAVRYDFWGRSNECTTETSQCTGRQRVDVLGLADGTRYNITTLDDDQLAEMVGYANATLQVSDMPKRFDELLI